MLHISKSQLAMPVATNARPPIVTISAPSNAAFFANGFAIPVDVGTDIETET
jgi:hypothetical protein